MLVLNSRRLGNLQVESRWVIRRGRCDGGDGDECSCGWREWIWRVEAERKQWSALWGAFSFDFVEFERAEVERGMECCEASRESGRLASGYDCDASRATIQVSEERNDNSLVCCDCSVLKVCLVYSLKRDLWC